MLGKPFRVAWVTGAAGFIGQRLVEHLRENDWHVVGIDRRPGTDIQGDVCEGSLERADRYFGPPSAIVHLAGPSTVRQALTQDDHVKSTRTVVDYIKNSCPDARLIYFSSAAVYGGRADGRVAPVSVYGEQKLEAETMIFGASLNDTIILRPTSIYGVGLEKQLPWDLGRKLLLDDVVVLEGTGSEFRDFIHVSDVIRVVMRVIDSYVSEKIINVGTGKYTSISELAQLMKQNLDPSKTIRFNLNIRPGDPTSMLVNVSGMDSLGVPALVQLRVGIARYCMWLRDRVMSEQAA